MVFSARPSHVGIINASIIISHRTLWTQVTLQVLLLLVRLWRNTEAWVSDQIILRVYVLSEDSRSHTNLCYFSNDMGFCVKRNLALEASGLTWVIILLTAHGVSDCVFFDLLILATWFFLQSWEIRTKAGTGETARYL